MSDKSRENFWLVLSFLAHSRWSSSILRCAMFRLLSLFLDESNDFKVEIKDLPSLLVGEETRPGEEFRPDRERCRLVR